MFCKEGGDSSRVLPNLFAAFVSRAVAGLDQVGATRIVQFSI